MKIEHLVRRDFVTVNPYSGINSVKKQLLEHSAIVVQDEEQFYGVLTAKDIAQNPRTLIIDCVTIKTIIDCNDPVDSVIQIMNDSKTDVLPVSHRGKIIGLVFKSDLYDYIADYNSELESRIKERTQELEKSIALKDLMFSVIAHDLRNPFNAILGFTDLLSKNIREYTVDNIEEKVKLVYAQEKNVYDLLDNLLNWAKSNNGQLAFNPTMCNISQICNEVIDNIRDIAKMKNIAIKSFHEFNEPIFADKNMVETILRNLLSNAIKFTETDGKIEVYSNLNGSFVEIVVSDNGVGMHGIDKEKLFNLDFNKSHTGTAKEKGTGLGLVICKEFIERQGGKIWVEDKADKGSEFKFTLPKYQGQTA